jgi:hypothetical protein
MYPMHPMPPAPQPPPDRQRLIVMAAAAGGVLLFVLALIVVGFARGKAAPAGPRGGEVKYGHSGIEDGVVHYDPPVSEKEAQIVGAYLREKRWYPGGGFGTPDNPLQGIAQGTYGLGASGRGHGGAGYASVVATAKGYTVMVVAGAARATIPAVKEFAAQARDDLTTRLGKPVSFVVRVEEKKGRGLAWEDSTWE